VHAGSVTDWGTGVFTQWGSSVTTSGATSFFSTRTHTGFDARTSNGLGTLQLVSPTMIITGIDAQFDNLIPVTGKLEIRFVPEPSKNVLGLAGVAFLLALGRWRARRRPGGGV
jgi:hypothetical protein